MSSERSAAVTSTQPSSSSEPWITMGLRWEPKKRSVAMRQLPKDTPDRRYMTLVHSRSTTSSSTTTTTTSSSSSFLSVAVAAPPPASLLPLHFPLPLPSFVAAAPPQPLPPSLFHLLHLFLMLSSMQLLCRDKNEISAEAVDAMGKALFAYLETHNNTLHWRPVIARNSCTYGRFDDEFEELLLKHRPKVGEKDLPWEDHPDLPREERPMFAHMRHSDLPDADPRKAALLRFAPGTVYTFRFDLDQ